jgi:hypothetical protein
MFAIRIHAFPFDSGTTNAFDLEVSRRKISQNKFEGAELGGKMKWPKMHPVGFCSYFIPYANALRNKARMSFHRGHRTHQNRPVSRHHRMNQRGSVHPTHKEAI